jgi:DNA-binding transcriptional MerR regulator
MAEIAQQVEIPNRALFKAAEVCDLVKVQPYVLRSWESEFKDLGVSKGGSTTRVYRREDIELVLRIKHLLLIEGLTLAGVRRRLEEEAEPPLEEDAVVPSPVGLNASTRERIGEVKRSLRSLLAMLDSSPSTTEGRSIAVASTDFALAPPDPSAAATTRPAKRSAGKERSSAQDQSQPTKSASPRRKRSA